MLTTVAFGLTAAGLVLVTRKLSSSFRSMLDLSDDLDTPRSMRSRYESPGPAAATLGRGSEPCSESMLRLSGAVAGSRNAQSDSKQVSVETELPIAQR